MHVKGSEPMFERNDHEMATEIKKATTAHLHAVN
jgi:hypothetical protein